METIAPNDLIDGELYYVDAGYGNGGIVRLISHGLHFCTVVDPDDDCHPWTTMIYRLSEIQQTS